MATPKPRSTQSSTSTRSARAEATPKRKRSTPGVTVASLEVTAQGTTPAEPAASTTPSGASTTQAAPVTAPTTPSGTAPPTGSSSATEGSTSPVVSSTGAPAHVLTLTVTLPDPGIFSGPVGAPPAVTVPSVPAGFVKPATSTLVGSRPSERQVAAAPLAVIDLQSFSNYATLLGQAAPPVGDLIVGLNVALAWHLLRQPSEAWDEYVRCEDGLAWKWILAQLDVLRPIFLNAIAQNPSLASKYQGLAKLLDARNVSARQAVVTRKKNAKTQAAQAAATAAAVKAVTPAAAQAPASAPATSAKTVNVNV
jgi:hypothetical protein